MTKKTKPIVFDAHAILKWLEMEQGWEEVKKILVAYRKSAFCFNVQLPQKKAKAAKAG